MSMKFIGTVYSDGGDKVYECETCKARSRVLKCVNEDCKDYDRFYWAKKLGRKQ